MTMLKRQFITDADGQPIGIILPLEEYQLVAATLEQRLAEQHVAVMLERMEAAVQDPLFLADLTATMHDFAAVDAEWWEREA